VIVVALVALCAVGFALVGQLRVGQPRAEPAPPLDPARVEEAVYERLYGRRTGNVSAAEPPAAEVLEIRPRAVGTGGSRDRRRSAQR
jgi:hypothetical protein